MSKQIIGDRAADSLKENMLCRERILDALPAKERDLQVAMYGMTDSTNMRAKCFATGAFTGHALFVADGQQQGRGRLGRTFYSPAGTGLYLSYLFSTKEPLERLTALTPAAAVVCARAIEHLCGEHVGIKWVNDLYLRDKKVCGILTEAVSASAPNEEHKIIIGVGINLTTQQFPKDLEHTAGALDKSIDRSLLASEIAHGLIGVKNDLYNRAFMEEYTARSVVLGKRVRMIRGDEETEGIVEGFDGDGGLLLRTDGGLRLFTGGEISLRFSEI